MHQVRMKPIKNSSTDEQMSEGHGIWFHMHYTASKFSQLKMQSQDKDFMRNLNRNYFRDFAFVRCVDLTSNIFQIM